MADRSSLSDKLLSNPLTKSVQQLGNSVIDTTESTINGISRITGLNALTSNTTSIPFNGTNVNTRSAANTSSVTSTSIAKFSPLLNPMSSIDQPSYHWTFFIAPETVTSTQISSEIDLNNVSIIAETGVTSFNILSTDITSFVGPNFQTRNALMSNFSMKIYEPVGFSFVDSIFAAASSMGIRNFMKCPYYLRLELVGQDPITGQPIRQVGNKIWTWRILLTKIETNLSTSGSIHTIEAIPFDEIGTYNQYGVIPSPISIDLSFKEQPTVSDVFNSIIDQMNKFVLNSYGYQFVTYAVKANNYPSDIQSGDIKSPFDHKIVRSIYNQDSSRSQKIIQLSKGTDVAKVLDYVLAASDTAIKLINPLNDQNNATVPNSNTINPVTTIHNITINTEITNYDPVTRDYMKKITFIVTPYRVFRTVVQGQSLAQDNSTTQAQADAIEQKKFNIATSKNYLKKEYNYVYTGQNTEVLNLDIDLNFQFNVASNFYSGKIFHEMNSTGRVYDQDNNLLKKIQDQQELGKQIKSLQQSLTASSSITPTIGVRNQTTGVVETTNTENVRKQYTTNAISALKQQFNSGLQASIDAQATLVKNSNNSISALSGVNYAQTLLENSTMQNSMPIVSFIQDPNNPRDLVNNSIESNNLSGKSIYGMILNQLYGTFDNNLQNITLEIRGDPYWLNDQIAYGSLGGSEQAGGDTNATFIYGEHIIVLKFGIPKGYNDQTGDPIITTSDLYSGFYAVTKVEHQFHEGIFKQVLNCTRVPSWSISKYLK